ncbi:transcriptional regulator [Oceanicola sp. 22II-s10i]|uniref:helix-turn-helix transcriptional regulator n=1 Tax=Oceanicola sp. 22II-s10i TaxID=1317116 RepID=UPI000B52104C|nr:WYL domain-containing protein [Oceanicola sp. 22II-s10i]OWU86315.1 transcriptional regulator [Oceanicola sp. 22II-s10i]
MPRTDRLFRLLDLMRRLPQPVTAARLAEETGVSERTLYRDIDALRSAGARIEGEAGYGYTLAEDPALPPLMFDRLEIEALVLGLAEVRQMADAELAAAADSALARLAASVPERVQRQLLHAVTMSYQFAPPSPGVHAKLLRDAAWEERVVEIAYSDAQGQMTRRRVKPLALVFTDRATTLLAWCCLRRGFRRFRLPRISEARLTEESFRPERVALLRGIMEEMRGNASPQQS